MGSCVPSVASGIAERGLMDVLRTFPEKKRLFAPFSAPENNQDKFPIHYMFELSSSELRDLKSKILISNVSPNNRKSTKVFTERGQADFKNAALWRSPY